MERFQMKKILISIIFLLFCLSDSYAFLSKTKEIDPDEYLFLLIAKDLQIYNLELDLSGASEKAYRKKWINGAYDIKYEYDRRDSDNFHPLFFSAKLEIDKSIAKAKETYRDGLKVITKMSSVAGMPCREIKNIIQWGDENYYALRLKEGNPVGMIFSGRLKNKVYTIIMAGLYSSDHSLLTDLVIPKLQSIDSFQIKE
jgi:hypothetical protein